MSRPAPVVILTPVKNGAAHADGYVDRLLALDYPADALSLGVLVSDSTDGSFDVWSSAVGRLREAGWRRVSIVQRDFGFHLPPDVPRYAAEVQVQRRTVLARSRNHLLFHALRDEEWVLWLDCDVVEYQPDILRLLILHQRDIIHPNCVREWGGRAFDRNAWADGGRRHLDGLRERGWLVPLESVGGTMLLIRADRHRDGLVFPPYLYGRANRLVRTDRAQVERDELGEIETEGLALMADDMGIERWGLPHVEIRHE